MTAEEIERKALFAALDAFNRGGSPIGSMRQAIDAYDRTRWRLESEAHNARQAHQREVNVLAATAK